jgi:hypothetical protein
MRLFLYFFHLFFPPLFLYPSLCFILFNHLSFFLPFKRFFQSFFIHSPFPSIFISFLFLCFRPLSFLCKASFHTSAATNPTARTKHFTLNGHQRATYHQSIADSSFSGTCWVVHEDHYYSWAGKHHDQQCGEKTAGEWPPWRSRKMRRR